MKLEWDEAKRIATIRERGLDFADVAQIDWDTADTREDTRSQYGEARYVTLAPIDGRLFVVVWCEREDSMRVISLRKANDRERRRYGTD